jgi:hypothetical protein
MSSRIFSILALIALANCPKSGLVSNSGNSFSRKANSSFSIGNRIMAGNYTLDTVTVKAFIAEAATHYTRWRDRSTFV